MQVSASGVRPGRLREECATKLIPGIGQIPFLEGEKTKPSSLAEHQLELLLSSRSFSWVFASQNQPWHVEDFSLLDSL